MLNRVILIGRLTKKPELRFLPNGTATAGFTLAVDRPFKTKDGEKQTDFLPIVTWRKQAENCAEYLDKGSLVAVDGRLQIRSYEQDGKRRYITEVVADSVRFLDSRKKQEPDYGGYQGTEVDEDEDSIPF
jgi:single-strand DNA-binding protein